MRIGIRSQTFEWYHFERPSVTQRNIQWHEASRGLSATAVILVLSSNKVLIFFWGELQDNMWGPVFRATIKLPPTVSRKRWPRDRPFKHYMSQVTGTRLRLNCTVNPLQCKGRPNYSATSNNMKLVHWPLMDRLLHLVQRWDDCAGPQPAQAPPRCTKCNSPPITGQCTNHRIRFTCPLLCGFNVPTNGLNARTMHMINNWLTVTFKSVGCWKCRHVYNGCVGRCRKWLTHHRTVNRWCSLIINVCG